MCLILIAWQTRADYPLVLAANRDERYARPSLPLDTWEEAPDILGGRDLEAGGSWLAIHRDGRFAAVTNLRAGAPAQAPRSRGALVGDYLRQNEAPEAFAARLDLHDYAGFNLLLGSPTTLHYLGNGPDAARRQLPPGIYGLSNHRLDTPWPKLVAAKAAFRAALAHLPQTAPFFTLLADRTPAADAELPDTGIDRASERLLSSIFVASPTYGTRASTLLLRRRDGSITMHEHRFGPHGEPLGQTVREFQASTISTGV
jgi:uncharacterized protein with NRDE domain